MSEYRVVDRRCGREEEENQEEAGCGGGCNGCDGGCCGRTIPQPSSNEAEVLFAPGMIVKSVLTGEKLMVLKADPDTQVSYVVRTSKYEAVHMLDFEIEAT